MAEEPGSTSAPATVDALVRLLAAGRYVADRSLATALLLALKLGRPLLLEGEAGVGKTELAKVVAAQLGRELIRLQCYEGLDVASAVYEWAYARQMIEIRLAEAGADAAGERGLDRDALARSIYSERFLIRRPLLRALTPGPAGPPVLLIDELDRTDEPFEAFLLELLSDFQVTIPELGVIAAPEGARPIVILTSNRTREIHDALKRRCLYHWLDYPDAARELAIVRARAPAASAALREQVVAFVQGLRGRQPSLFKPPGVAESIDWTRALLALDRELQTLSPTLIEQTLGVLLKYRDDVEVVRDELRGGGEGASP